MRYHVSSDFGSTARDAGMGKHIIANPRRKGSGAFTPSQMMALALGVHIRNELERLHGQISDELMAELNVAIRYAIYDFHEVVSKDEDHLYWLVRSIPPYWEVPGRDPRPVFTGEPLFMGKPYTPDMRERLAKMQAQMVRSEEAATQ
jgi:hypothetical protein